MTNLPVSTDLWFPDKLFTQNDLGDTVMARADDRRVVLVLKRRRAKVDESNVRVAQNRL